MAYSTPKTWATSEVLTSTDMNTYVRDNTSYLYDQAERKLGYTKITSNQTGITSMVDLTGLTTTVTVGSSRLIRVSFQVCMNSTVSFDACEVDILEDGSGKTQIFGIAVVNASSLAGSVLLTPSSGSHTYKLQMGRAAGTGTLGSYAGATRPAHILVEDIGPA